MTVTELQTYLDAARDAILAENYPEARRQLLAAKTVLAGIPDGRHGPAEVRWRNEIDSLLAEVDKTAPTDVARSFQTSKVRYRPATSCGSTEC